MGALFNTPAVTAGFHPNTPFDNTVYLDDRKILSWGPRVQREDDPTNCVPPEEDELPAFYTVFTHEEDGRARMLCDVATEKEAVKVTRACFPGILLRECLLAYPVAVSAENAAIFMHTVREQIAAADAAFVAFTPRD